MGTLRRNEAVPQIEGYRIGGVQWLTGRRAELLPVPYFRVSFTLPEPIADIAHQTKAVVYDPVN